MINGSTHSTKFGLFVINEVQRKVEQSVKFSCTPNPFLCGEYLPCKKRTVIDQSIDVNQLMEILTVTSAV